MDSKILETQMEFLVERQHTARNIGSGTVDVLATPSMILFMEITCLRALQEILSDKDTSVGTDVTIQHINAVPQNQTVKIISSVEKKDEKKVIFNVKCLWRDKIIGQGRHTRFIVNKERFESKIKNMI